MASNRAIAYKILKRNKKGRQRIIRDFYHTRDQKYKKKTRKYGLFLGFGLSSSGVYEEPAEYSASYGGDECRAGVRGMQSPFFPKAPPFKAGSFTKDKLSEKRFFRR